MNSKQKLTLLFVLIISVSLFVTIPYAQAKSYKKGKCSDISITFVSVESHTKGTKYTYYVKSGSRHSRIRYWFLISDAFRRYQVVASSEKAVQRRRSRILFFPKVYRNDDSREVWFVLKHAYTPSMLTDIPYRARITGRLCRGWVDGPKIP